ncbi:MAG: restriction endonuclease, partial [Gammaproteobacteria bacterium]|nr:restriction endonuclease [Gammaproteobacteria bacterium]
MPRKKKTLLNDIIDISSQLPWWVGLGLAIIIYMTLSIYNSQEVVTASTGGVANVGVIVIGSITKALATAAQYLFPFAFILGAGTSALQQYKRSNLLNRASSREGKTAIDSMSWREFEMMVGEAFRQRGFKVKETPFGPDGGVDLVLTKNDQKILVQCKHWKTQKVGVKTVRELYGVLVAESADEVNIVCSGEFTSDAFDFVKDKPIYLIDGNVLSELIQGVQSDKYIPSRSQSISCPVCGSDMVLRLAKQGAHAGNQ